MKKAFTLMEILIVVAIIGILLAVSVPLVRTSVIKSREARLKSDLAMVRQALEAARNDTGVFPAPWELDDATPPAQGWLPTTIGAGWPYVSFNPQLWKGPYLANYPSTNPLTGTGYTWNSVQADNRNAFYLNYNATATDGTNYRTW